MPSHIVCPHYMLMSQTEEWFTSQVDTGLLTWPEGLLHCNALNLPKPEIIKANTQNIILFARGPSSPCHFFLLIYPQSDKVISSLSFLAIYHTFFNYLYFSPIPLFVPLYVITWCNSILTPFSLTRRVAESKEKDTLNFQILGNHWTLDFHPWLHRLVKRWW